MDVACSTASGLGDGVAASSSPPSPGFSLSEQRACHPTATLGWGGQVEAASPDPAYSSEALHPSDNVFQPSSFESTAAHVDFSHDYDLSLHDDDGRPVAHSNVPGARASTIRIHSVWHCLPRLVLSSKTKFSVFFRAMLTRPRATAKKVATASPWPMPLPYHFGRTSTLDDKEVAFRKLLNLQVGILNFFHLGEPELPPSYICLGHTLNDDQWKIIRRLRRLEDAWCNLAPIVAKDMGRTASKQERQEDILSDLSDFAGTTVRELKKYDRGTSAVKRTRPEPDVGSVVGRVRKSDINGAQPIVASRIKMEGTPNFDPVPYLDDNSRELHENPHVCGISTHDVDPGPPKVRVHADFDEKVSLLKILEDSGRLIFRAPSEVIPKFGNGLFCVPKNTEVDRLILDGRPANLLQKPPNKFIMTMASATGLLGLRLEDNEKLLMSGDDLSNFFYTFKVNYKRGSRNFLDWKIPVSVASKFASFPAHLLKEDYVYACLNSLAMGDSAACEFAQTSHISLGLLSGAFTPDELITMHGRIPRTPTMAGIIIDDFILLEKVALDSSSSKRAGDHRQRMHDIYHSVGLNAHPSKGFQDEETATFWGADVDGRAGLIRSNIARAASLAWVTTRVATMGLSSVGLLEVLAGGYVSLFGFRRRMMSLLDWIYVIQGGRDRRDIISLPKRAIDELWSLAILTPLAVADLRACFAETIYMVDSSNWGDAVVACDLPKTIAAEIHRHGIMKSCWTRLLSPFKALQRAKGLLPTGEELPPDEEPFTEHPLWECCARCLPYHLVWKSRAKNNRHINLGELKSYLKAEELGGSEGDVRVPIEIDSQVVLGAIAKGRSASPAINKMLRKSLGVVLGFGVYSSGGYVRSAHNPSDDPTRGVQLRAPTAVLPNWWIQLANGDFSAFDSLLVDCDLHPDQLCGYPSLNELYLKEPATFDPIFKSSHNRKHSAVRHRLRLRKCMQSTSSIELGKDTAEDSVDNTPDWSKQVAEILDSFGSDQIFRSEDCPWPPRSPGFLDLYSGKKGFAKSSLRYGAPWVLVVDINDGPQCDLLDSNVRRRIEAAVRLGAFIHISAAPICSSFSRAVTPAVRSRLHPRGLRGITANMRLKVRDGNSHSIWLASLVCLAISLGIQYWVENPDSSFLWIQPEWEGLPGQAAYNYFKVDFCTYGTPWRKRTRFLTNGRLANVRRLCPGNHVHVLLRGRSKQHKAAWTKVAEPYPRRLCAVLAHSACCDLGLFRGPSTLTCRSNHRRIGEAKNPGPIRKRPFGKDPEELERVNLIRPETVALGKDQWDKFFSWMTKTLRPDIALSVWKVPSLMGAMMAAYGKEWYACGGALYCYRHLVVYAQRLYPTLKGHMQQAWGIISKWEELEPIQHRRPIPLSMLNSMVALSLLWGWHRVASVLLIAFHACARPGEVLKAKRASLILAEDIGGRNGEPCFLKICKPKPGRRGLGRVQHAKLRDSHVTSFLGKTFADVDPHAFIYPGSASSFRTRWDLLLKKLRIPPSTGLTPGCLRAGGTVELYIRGMPIMDILWALRLKNLETLQHYLQEISTQITLIDLPMESRHLIFGFAAVYDRILSLSTL